MKKTYLFLVISFLFCLNTFAQVGFELQIIEDLNSSDNNFIRSMHTVDLDGDGDLDLIYTDSGLSQIIWRENLDGLGEFSEEIIILDEVVVLSAFPMDFDEDGDVDIVYGHSGSIYWIENIDGEGNFGEQQLIDDYLYTVNLILGGDADADGDMDLFVYSNPTSSVRRVFYYENLGSGIFDEKYLVSFEESVTSLYLADMDNDNDLDIVAGSYLDSNIFWFEKIDIGTYGQAQSINLDVPNLKSVFVEDMDGDGDNDVLFSRVNMSNGADLDREVGWIENINSASEFGDKQAVDTVLGGDFVMAADLDNDNDIDIIAKSHFESKIVWYQNLDGQGNFGEEQIIKDEGMQGVQSVIVADFGGDDDLDIIYGSWAFPYRLAWYENTGLLFNKITGKVMLDLALDGCDISDLHLNNIKVVATDGENTHATFTRNDGNYSLFTGEGVFTIAINDDLPYYFTGAPTSYSSSFEGFENVDSGLDFCLQINQAINDLGVEVYPISGGPRPGFDTTYRIIYKNQGTTVLSGTIDYEFNADKLSFLSASETVASQSTGAVAFDFIDLNPFETRYIDLEFNVFAPPTTNIDDVLESVVSINPVANDETEEDNSFTLSQVVIGSYDPNDITCLEGEHILMEDADSYLHYLVRFQNTGTASAINVRVEQLLDEKLDWSSMQLESLSHEGRVEIVNGNEISFIFDDINLADSTNDEPNSHGFIAYKIKPLNSVEVGDVFSATADIYFDYNPAVVTNTATTEIVETLSQEDYIASKFTLFPNPVKNRLTIKGGGILDEISICDINGRILIKKEITSNKTEEEINVGVLVQGVYYLRIRSQGEEEVFKFIKN